MEPSARLSPRAEPLDQSREQAPNLFYLTGSLGMQRTGQKPKIPREKEIILKFVRGAEGVKEKPPEIRVTAPPTSLGNIGRN